MVNSIESFFSFQFHQHFKTSKTFMSNKSLFKCLNFALRFSQELQVFSWMVKKLFEITWNYKKTRNWKEFLAALECEKCPYNFRQLSEKSEFEGLTNCLSAWIKRQLLCAFLLRGIFMRLLVWRCYFCKLKEVWWL